MGSDLKFLRGQVWDLVGRKMAVTFGGGVERLLKVRSCAKITLQFGGNSREKDGL